MSKIHGPMWVWPILIVIAGCASTSTYQARVPVYDPPSLNGSHHVVQRGETLWRIARSFGLDVQSLASVNRLSDALFVMARYENRQRGVDDVYWESRA